MSDILTLWKQQISHLRIFTIFVVIKCMYDKRKRNITHAPLLFVEATHNKQAVYSLNKLKNKQLKQLLDLKRA